MATVYFIGKAPAVAQTATVQVTGFDATTTYTVTINGVDVEVAGNTDINTTASDLQAALAASTHPYFTALTASVATDTITLTAATAGVPFTATSSVTGGTGTIGSVTAGVASSGPNDWSTAANWSGSSVPVSTDTVIIADSSVQILWGLDQSAVTLTELRILQSYTGRIGLPDDVFTFNGEASNTSTSSVADEYRDTYLQIGATDFVSGLPAGTTNETGSGRIKVDFGSVATTAWVFNSSATPVDQVRESVRLKGTNASNVLHVSGGRVGSATENASELATWSEIHVAATSNSGTLALNLGAGCTLTTINIGTGNVTNRGANVTTLVATGGVYTVLGSATHTTLEIQDGASCVYNTDGILTNLVLGGKLDSRGDTRPKTITNAAMYEGYELLVGTGNFLSVTFTNGIDLVNTSIAGGTLDLGRDLTVTPSAI